MQKLDIMNMRAGEEWIVINGKVKRKEKKVIIIGDSIGQRHVKKILSNKKKRINNAK